MERALADLLTPLRPALEAARDVDAPDWLICAGAIRDAVWDALRDRAPAPPRDVDLGFFGGERDEAQVTAALVARAPQIPWDARDQAAVHRWYPQRFGIEVEPFSCTADAIATFPEVASCVGIRLGDGDGDDGGGGALQVVAPYGLDDLLGLVCRHNPARAPRELYERRIADKGWAQRWPRLRFA